jgi:ADP-heptose:LPS heptosyltransferase
VQIRSDCVHFKGETPCVFKRLCDGCPEFTPFGTKILLIKRAAMGDVLRTTALLPGLKRKYPQSAIFWAVDPESEDLLRNNPHVARIVPWTADNLLALRAARFDVVICLDKDPGSTALATLLPAERKLGFGMNEHGNLIPLNAAAWTAYRLGVDDDLKFRRNERTYQEIIAEAAEVPWENDPYILILTEADRAPALEFMRTVRGGSGRPAVGLNTGAGSKFETKQWPVEHYRGLIRLLTAKLGADVFLLGGEREREMNAALAASGPDRVFDTGTDHPLREFAGFVEAMDVVVSSDSLGMHIAVALGRKVVALFGSTSSREIFLYGRGVKIDRHPACGPCYKKTCPDMTCMIEIRPEAVFEEIARLL